MREPANRSGQRTLTLLPDFCSMPVLFALLVLAAITASVMLLAPGSALTLHGFTLAMLFAVWLALIHGVCLCKLRPTLARLPFVAAYGGVWLVIVVVVLVASAVVAWLDHRLATGLTPPDGTRFVVGNTAVAVLIAAALLRYFHVVAQWQERMRSAAQARAEALQARIRPHFLFNSMNTVAALTRSDPQQAERTVENLSQLFRAALGAEDREGTLGEELELIERYLAIEQLRLGDRLRVAWQTAEAPADLPMPSLLLQPLVENAVYHGIQGRREGGVVRINARQSDGVVEIVIDNPLPEAPAPSGHGHAQDNVRHRIGYHFGGRGGLTARVEGDRYCVCVRIPLERG